MTDQETQVLLKTLLRSTKDQSSFIYFTLEANEGLAFYTTQPHQEGDKHRDIECFTPISLKDEFLALIESLKEPTGLIIIEQTEVKDGF